MPYFGIFYPDFIIVSRILQVNSRSSHTRKFYLPHENRETSPPFLCTTHEASSPAHTKCVPSRARSAVHRAGVLLRSAARWTRDVASAVHRAGHLLRSVRMVDAGGGFCRSAALRLPSVLTFTHPRHRPEISLPRTRSVFHHTMGFHRSVARRTREHAKRVSSRRMHSPFYTRAGRERSLPPFAAVLADTRKNICV